MPNNNALYRHSITIADEHKYLDYRDIKVAMARLVGKKGGYIFQLEAGEERGKKHWQCSIKLGDTKKRRTTVINELHLFLTTAWDDSFEEEGHRAPASHYRYPLAKSALHVRPTHDAHAADFYAMKKDTRLEGPYSDKKIYMGADLPTKLFPWQAQLENMVLKEPDNRTIHWITDLEGNKGKSVIVKKLCFEHLEEFEFLAMGRADQVKSCVVGMGARTCYFLDVPRTIGVNESLREMMSAIESIKNGMVATAMYGKPKKLFMAPPHVVCFANMPPPRELCSADRWREYKIDSAFGLVQIGAVPKVDLPRLTAPPANQLEIEDDSPLYNPPEGGGGGGGAGGGGAGGGAGGPPPLTRSLTIGGPRNPETAIVVSDSEVEESEEEDSDSDEEMPIPRAKRMRFIDDEAGED